MKSYKVLRSFSGREIGRHSEGDVIQLADAEAENLVRIGFLQPMAQPEAAPIETADLPVEKVEQAVIKRTKKRVSE